MNDDEPKDKGIAYRQVAAFITLPFVLAVPPLLGGLFGGWLDRKFGSDPWLTLAFVGLGLIAGFRETLRIVRKFGTFDK